MDLRLYSEDFACGNHSSNEFEAHFTYLREFDEHLEELNLEFIYPFNSEVIESTGLATILVIGSDKEIVNIKFEVDSSDEVPLRIKKSSKFTNIAGHQIITNNRHTYIQDKKGNVFKFRSAQSLDKLKHENVIYLNCFNFLTSCCFTMISLVDSKVVLYLYDKSYSKEYAVPKRCIDLILPEDSIQSLENEFTFQKVNDDFVFSSEMLANVIENDLDVEFFSKLLSIDMKNENIHIQDILLVSINDRIFNVKYQGAMDDENDEPISMETILMTRGKVKAMKYLDSSLIILDDFWVLTIFYQCVKTDVIKRREIPLGDEITCFKFTNNSFIYSNRHKIIFMKFRLAPSDPEISEVNLRLVSTFSIAQTGHYLLAIDRNKLFYHVPIPQHPTGSDSIDTDEDFSKVTDDEIKKFPEIVKYLENIEQDFKQLADTIENENNMLILMTHLQENNDITAGQAQIKFVPFLTALADDLICDPINSQSGFFYMRIDVDLEPIFSAFTFTIAFYRHTLTNGILLRHIQVSPRNQKMNFAIYVPDEIGDCHSNKLELFANFYINKSTECQVLQFPFTIESIEASKECENRRKNVQLENVTKSLNKLLQN